MVVLMMLMVVVVVSRANEGDNWLIHSAAKVLLQSHQTH